MTAQEINRDIKRLARMQKLTDRGDMDIAFEKEFIRLYYADTEFKYMNRNSILIMYRLNQRYRIVPFHAFGIMVSDHALGIKSN